VDIPRARRLLVAAAGYAVALAAGIAVLGVGEVENILSSPPAVLRFAAAGAVWVLLAYVALPRLLPRGVRRTAVRGVVVTLALAGALASTLRTTTVHDVAPDLAVAAGVADPTAAASSSTARTPAGPATEAPGATPTGTPTAASRAPAAATRLGTGTVAGINHKGAGRAVLIRLADGSHVVRFEGLDVDNAPDMRVWLVRGRDRDRTGDGVDLGRLKGNKGDQNYRAPERTAITPGKWTVLIWCRAFAVPIANATVTVG
jgi:hypothetical protein